ncbi:MAG: MarR family transcriptional regulator [Bacteroidota bacterium]
MQLLHMDFILPRDTIFYECEKAMKLYRKLAQASINRREVDISVNQLILLIEIIERPESTQVELSQKVFKDFASVTRMVQILVKNGYLVRVENEQDRRKKDLIPTKAGQQIVQQLIPVIEEYRAIALAGISLSEIQRCIAVFSKLSANCESGIDKDLQ